jgi:hypothetical protein
LPGDVGGLAVGKLAEVAGGHFLAAGERDPSVAAIRPR